MASTFGVDATGNVYDNALERRTTSAAYGVQTQSVTHTTNDKSGKSLDMSDFLQLMVATFQNQTIDNTADVSDMMNQMVQMSVIETITSLTSVITENANLSYAASLVGKEVTISQTSGRETRQITGVVTGTGMVNGQQMVFLGNDSYAMSDILAVGRIPTEEEENSVSLLNALDDEADRFPDTLTDVRDADSALDALADAKNTDSALDALEDALDAAEDAGGMSDALDNGESAEAVEPGVREQELVTSELAEPEIVAEAVPEEDAEPEVEAVQAV